MAQTVNRNPIPVVELLKRALAGQSIAHIKPPVYKHDGLTCKKCGKPIAEYMSQEGPKWCDCDVLADD